VSPTAVIASVAVAGARSVGYACGVVGSFVDGPAEVTLHRPVPLDAPLKAERHDDGRVTLHHDDVLVAEGEPALPLDLEPPHRVAAAVTSAALAGNGTVPQEHVWAALERALAAPGRLARMTAELIEPVAPGEPVLALGWPLCSESREHHTASVLLAADGRVLAAARAHWLR
jgi:hypothetical protein